MISGFSRLGGGNGLMGGGVYRPPRPTYSESVDSYNRGFGSGSVGGRGDSATSDRPFQLVGKNRINLLDPLARQREQARLMEQAGIEAPDHDGPLGFVEDYYDPANPAGVVGGLIGAAGQTIGGFLGNAQLGTEIGGLIGKTVDVPFNVFSQLPLPTYFMPFVDDANAAIEQNTPYLFRDIVKVPKTAGDLMSSLLNALGLGARAVERTVAGSKQLPTDLRARVDAGEIDEDTAYDMMVMEGRGFTDDPMSNLLMSIAFDPVNWATLGVGAIGAAAKGSFRLAGLVQKGGDFLNAADHGATLGALGDAARSGRLITEADISGLSRLDTYRLRTTMQRRALANADRNPLVSFAAMTRMHLVPSAREVFGHVDTATTSNLFVRAADRAIRVTDPVTFLGGRLFGTGAIGKRQAEFMATAAQSAVFAAHGPEKVRRLAEIADTAPGGGGSNTILDALGVHAGNVAQETALAEHIGDGLRAGKVPILSNTKGRSLSPTEAVRALLRGGAFDTNIGKHMELLIHKQIPALFVRRAGETEDMLKARVLSESRSKMQSLMGPEWDPNALKVGDLDEGMAALIHAAYYYGTGAKFHNEVVPAMARAQAAGTLPSVIADPTRLTLLAERQLTAQRVAAIEDAIAAGNVAVLRSLLSRYKNFDWLDGTAIEGQELLDRVQAWLDVNKARLPREVDLTDPTTGARYAGLPPELETWLADADAGFGYTLAEAPPDNIPRPDLYGAIRNGDGTLEGMDPWLDFLANPAGELGGGVWAGRAPSRMGAYLSRVTQHVRQERIRWEGQRRFITDMSKGSDSNGLDVPPAASQKLWRAIMTEAEHQRVQPRGLAPDDFSRIVRVAIENAKKVQDGQTMALENLSHHQVMNALLRATKGDLWTVGGTQWFTGRIKARAPGAGMNFWGQISERLYPQLRFALNPVFQLQELAEPYILNRMRGVSAPLDRNGEKFKEALATHNAVMQLVRTSFEPDGMMAESAEYLKLYAADYLGTRQAFGPDTVWGRFSARMRPGIGERKAALAALEAKANFGERFYRTGLSMYGQEEWALRWREMEQAALSLDKGDVAMKWMALNMHLADANGAQVEAVLDLLNPHNLGRRLRVTHTESPGAMTFRDIERTIDGVEQYNDGRTVALYRERTDAAGKPFKQGAALLDELRTTSETDWMLRAKGIKGIVADDEAIRTIWRMANAPDPKDFWAQYRKAYLSQVKGAGRAGTRQARDAELAVHKALLNIHASSEGLTEAEYIARHFQPNDYIVTLANATNVPTGALLDMRPDWLIESLSRTSLDTANLHDIERNLEYFRGESNWAGMDDFFYRSIPTQAVPRHGGLPLGTTNGQGYRGWGELDDIIEDAHYMDGGTQGRTLIRLRKQAEGRRYGFHPDPKLPMRQNLNDLDTNDLEVFDARTKTWRPLSDIRPYIPRTPDFLPPNEGVRAIYVPPGTPESVVGLYPVDIEAYLTTRHGWARQQYKGDAYAAINGLLRGYDVGSDLPIEVIEDAVTHLDELIARGALPQRKVLYRGVNLSRVEHEFDSTTLTVDFENLMEGDIIDDAGYLSFSDSLDTAGNFAEGGGHVYQKKPGQLHKSVYIHLDAPPGFNVAYLQGQETEHLVGANQKMRVVKRERREFIDKRGVPTIQYDLHVEPVGRPSYESRVNRLMLEELTPTQTVQTRLVRDAVNDPEGLRLAAEESIDRVGLLGAREMENAIAAGEAALPPTVVKVSQSLADDLAELDPDDIERVGRAIVDLRERMQDIAGYDDMAMRLMHTLAYAVSTEGGMRLGWKEVVRRLEDVWKHAPGSADNASREAMERALFKGVVAPQRSEPLEAVISDTLDVMLGNRSRRAVGRGELDEPVIVDQLTMMDAGYPEGTTPTAYTHEYVVGFYNRKAKAANAEHWNGRGDWTASEMALLSQLRWQRKLGKTGIAVDPTEVDSLTRTLPAGLYPKPGSALEPYAPLLDIYFQPEHRDKLVGLMDEVGLTVGQQMQDLGLPVLRMDGSGIGHFDGGAAQPMVPVTVIASDGMADDAADVLSYITGQEVWSFTKSEVDELTDLKALVPRVSLTVPRQSTEAFTQEFATELAQLLGARGEMRGATAHRLSTGDWALDIIDEGGVFKRLDDGALDMDDVQDQLDMALDHMGAPDDLEVPYREEYGTAYHAGPDMVDGAPDWEGHLGASESRLQARGSRLTGGDLTDLRTTYEYAFRQKLQSDAPKQYARAKNGESLRPGVLEDRRGGSVRGYTDVGVDGRAIIGAVGSPDPLTGVHELTHVFARTLDPSAKARIIAAHEDLLTVKRGNLQARIADARAKAVTAKSASARTRKLNEANALEAELGGLVSQVDWGTEHEEFLVGQFMKYIHQGRAANPEMVNAMEHFRTWTQKLKTELFPDGEAISPEMTAFFDQVFRKKTRDMTVPYSVEHETLRMAMKQQLRDSWDEAHGTHYYRKDRRWFERTANHPYIGVYPSSYMWGKVLPELVRFLALRPFGYETPLLAWNVLREVSDTMTYQSETNGDMRTFLKDNERALMLFSMLFPGVPNDVSGNASLPLRRIAEQSLNNQYKNAQGIPFGQGTGDIKDINYLSGMEDAVNYAIGPLGALRTGGEIVGMGQKLIEGLGGEKRTPEERAALEVGGLPGR